MGLIIDQEFKSIIPPLAKEELQQLEKNLVNDGCRDALVLWQGIIVDGHNRYEICNRCQIRFETKDIELESREAAKRWIVTNQLGRRNLQPYQ